MNSYFLTVPHRGSGGRPRASAPAEKVLEFSMNNSGRTESEHRSLRPGWGSLSLGFIYSPEI